MLILHGLYKFRPRRRAFRNDYCLSCGTPRRAVQIQTFDVLHIFWIPLVPLGFWKRWYCTTCRRQPHVFPGTRRSFKWAGFGALAVVSLGAWMVPADTGSNIGLWCFRILASLAALATLIHLLRSPKDPVLSEKLSSILPAMDSECPFCRVPLIVGPETSCPNCAVVRL